MDQGLSYTSTPYNYILITGNEKFSHIEQFNTAMANENGQVQFVAREWSFTLHFKFYSCVFRKGFCLVCIWANVCSTGRKEKLPSRTPPPFYGHLGSLRVRGGVRHLIRDNICVPFKINESTSPDFGKLFLETLKWNFPLYLLFKFKLIYRYGVPRTQEFKT